MSQCNAQTNARPSGPLLQTARGLELIKSCAKFYTNGVGVAKPTLQFSHPLGVALNQPAARQMFPSQVSKQSISAVAVMGSFFLVLASLAFAAITWWVATRGVAGGTEVAAGEASAISTQSANLKAAATAQTVSNTQSDIIIHKVKTQPIDRGALESNGSR